MAVVVAVVALAVSSFEVLACVALGVALFAVWARDVTLGELYGTKIQVLSMVLSVAAVGSALV